MEVEFLSFKIYFFDCIVIISIGKVDLNYYFYFGLIREEIVFVLEFFKFFLIGVLGKV